MLQLLARYNSWLTEGLSGRTAATSATPALTGASQVTARVFSMLPVCPVSVMFTCTEVVLPT